MTTTTTIRDKMIDIETELNGQFISRHKEIRGLLQALLSRQHILILGDPGTAKTSMCQAWAEGCELSFFRRLITQFSTPDELFGPVDIKSYKENGVFRRLTQGKAPDAEVVYLDEVFKGGPTILNSLLSLMEERIFDNDGVTVQCPLVTLIGTSNELPADDAGLDAFYDRFLLRYMVTYLDDASDFSAMLRSSTQAVSVRITSEELKLAQTEVVSLPISAITYDSMQSIWDALREEQISVSDRRYKQMLSVMQAHAWLAGFPEVLPDSVIVGADILWTKPDQQRLVERIVRTCVNPNRARAIEMHESASQAYHDAMQDTSRGSTEFVQDATLVRSMRESMDELLKQVPNDSEMKQLHKEILGWEQKLVAKVLEGRVR